MPVNLPTWLGAQGLEPHPTSGKVSADATKTSVVRVYEGPYTVCLASQPTIGQTFSDLPGTMVVVAYETIKAPSGQDGIKGRLTINLETPYATTFETEWVEVDKALIENPRYWCAAAGYPSDGVMVLTLIDRAMIEMWEKEDDVALKGPASFGGPGYCFKVLQGTTIGVGGSAPILTSQEISGYVGTFNIYQLSANAQDYAAKRLRGEESYRVYAPLVRQTSEFLDPPDVTDCGGIQNPPTDANAPSTSNLGLPYVYELTANRTTRTGPYGKYRQQLEWLGVEFIDPDLYGTEDPATAPNPPT